MSNLLNQIEQKRNEMIRYSFVYGLSSPKTIQSSQELDELINIYQIQHNTKRPHKLM